MTLSEILVITPDHHHLNLHAAENGRTRTRRRLRGPHPDAVLNLLDLHPVDEEEAQATAAIAATVGVDLHRGVAVPAARVTTTDDSKEVIYQAMIKCNNHLSNT